MPLDSICSIPDCDRRIHARGWCQVHYARWQRHSDPTGERTVLPEPVRFWPLVNKETAGCWRWTGHRNRRGYGQFYTSRGRVYAHRWAYEALVGAIPEGLVLDHLCRTPACVNPKHLEAVTQAENVRRGNGGAHHRRKTHCPKGHPYSGDNLYVNPRGRRECRSCDRARRRKGAVTQ